jgi:pseudouridine-5'-phosphate glycosidase
MNKYLSINEEIEEALAEKNPLVAFESNLITYGILDPKNIQFFDITRRNCRKKDF